MYKKANTTGKGRIPTDYLAEPKFRDFFQLRVGTECIRYMGGGSSEFGLKTPLPFSELGPFEVRERKRK